MGQGPFGANMINSEIAQDDGKVRCIVISSVDWNFSNFFASHNLALVIRHLRKAKQFYNFFFSNPFVKKILREKPL